MGIRLFGAAFRWLSLILALVLSVPSQVSAQDALEKNGPGRAGTTDPVFPKIGYDRDAAGFSKYIRETNSRGRRVTSGDGDGFIPASDGPIPPRPSSGSPISGARFADANLLASNADVSSTGVAGYGGNPGAVDSSPASSAKDGGVQGPAAQKAIYFYLNDHLGTPQKLIDEQGTVAWEADYHPFGEAKIRTAAIENNWRLPGQYFEADTGLHYNWHRNYDPRLGRYYEPDPIGVAGGVNFYSYAGNNPLFFFDPFGLQSIESIRAIRHIMDSETMTPEQKIAAIESIPDNLPDSRIANPHITHADKMHGFLVELKNTEVCPPCMHLAFDKDCAQYRFDIMHPDDVTFLIGQSLFLGAESLLHPAGLSSGGLLSLSYSSWEIGVCSGIVFGCIRCVPD